MTAPRASASQGRRCPLSKSRPSPPTVGLAGLGGARCVPLAATEVSRREQLLLWGWSLCGSLHAQAVWLRVWSACGGWAGRAGPWGPTARPRLSGLRCPGAVSRLVGISSLILGPVRSSASGAEPTSSVVWPNTGTCRRGSVAPFLPGSVQGRQSCRVGERGLGLSEAHPPAAGGEGLPRGGARSLASRGWEYPVPRARNLCFCRRCPQRGPGDRHTWASGPGFIPCSGRESLGASEAVG